MNGSRIVHVGTPSSDFKEWTTTEVCFHNYADLSTETGEYEASPEFSCLGRQWKLYIHPGGRENSSEGMVAVYLRNNMSDKSIKIEWGVSVKDAAAGKEVVYRKPHTVDLAARGSSGNASWQQVPMALSVMYPWHLGGKVGILHVF